ncbi:hypothetical protein D5086_017420 [Populus alba]|uniref:Uncharacterized protein n=1 Tax=Populus alba TaxID=43335 RepID=A0ACC4BWP8_POPAL
MLGKALTESHRPSSPVRSTGTPTVPQSPSLVHFSNFTATSSCTFLDTDLGMYKERWRSLGHNTSSCAKNSSHKCKQHAQTTPTPFGCSNPSADTKAVEKQPLQEEPQGESEFDPMSTEAVVAREEQADISDHKRAKLITPAGPLDDHPSGSLLVVSVSEDDTTAELPPRRQYLTRSFEVQRCLGVELQVDSFLVEMDHVGLLLNAAAVLDI